MGAQIAALAQKNFKTCELELGGVDPIVFFADVDVQESVNTLVNAKLKNNGQICCAPKRIFVHAAILSDFKKALLEEIDKAFKSPKYSNGILYGSDLIEDTIEKQLQSWKQSDSHDSKVLRGSMQGQLAQELNLIEVQGSRFRVTVRLQQFADATRSVRPGFRAPLVRESQLEVEEGFGLQPKRNFGENQQCGLWLVGQFVFAE